MWTGAEAWLTDLGAINFGIVWEERQKNPKESNDFHHQLLKSGGLHSGLHEGWEKKAEEILATEQKFATAPVQASFVSAGISLPPNFHKFYNSVSDGFWP